MELNVSNKTLKDLDEIFQVLISHFKISVTSNDADCIRVFHQLEKRFKTKDSCEESFIYSIRIKDDLLNNSDSTPRLIKNKNTYIITVHHDKIITEANCFKQALWNILQLYAVFNITYPRKYEKVLGFFHELLFDTGVFFFKEKSTKYIKLLHDINSRLS